MDIRVPHLAEGVESGTVVSVMVKEGDKVTKDQTVVELETNKAVAAVPAPDGGVVSKIHVKEGDTVPVGGLLVSLSGGSKEGAASGEESKETPKQESGKAETSKVQTAQEPAPVQGQQQVYQHTSSSGFPPPASPSVRKMARELGIDLSRVRGTEQGGRITMADVRNYIAYLQQNALTGSPQSSALTKPEPVSIDFSKWGPVVKKPATQLRKTIAQAMTDSWTTIPHVTQFDDIDITPLMQLRKKYVEAYEKKGARLTVTTFVLKAIVDTLKQHTIFNASYDEVTREIVYKDYFHIGIAVDTEHGLIVPVLRDVDKKNLFDISKEVVEIAEKTRARKISLEEMKGGSFTISNQGGIGGRHFTPIVNKPELAIMGLGRAFASPVYVKEKLEKRMMMPVALSYDHRLIDGAMAARFMVDFAKAVAGFSEEKVELAGRIVRGSSKPQTKSSRKGKS